MRHPQQNYSISQHATRIGLPVLSVLALLAAVLVVAFMPGETVYPILRFVEYDEELGLADTVPFAYNDDTVFSFESGEEEGFPFVRVHAQVGEHHSGVGFLMSSPWDQEGLHLRMRWRRTGSARLVQIDVHEKRPDRDGANIFSSWDRVPIRQWDTVEIPLRRFMWNQMANPQPPQDRPPIETQVESVSLTFEPEMEYRIDIASLDLVKPSAKGPWTSLLLGIAVVAFGMYEYLGVQTRRRRAEANLRASEAHYEKIFNAINDGLLVLDPESGAVLSANRTACALLGYLNEPALQADAPHALRRILEAIQANEAHFEWTFTRSNGDEMTLDIHLQHADLGDAPRLLAILRDIRAQKRAQTERRALEEQLQQAHKLEAIGRLAGGGGPRLQQHPHRRHRYL